MPSARDHSDRHRADLLEVALVETESHLERVRLVRSGGDPGAALGC
ncbi:MAG: hypothetical protein ACRDRR_16645 [Pseudonocardiaceae bacterium]